MSKTNTTNTLKIGVEIKDSYAMEQEIFNKIKEYGMLPDVIQIPVDWYLLLYHTAFERTCDGTYWRGIKVEVHD